MGHGDDFGLRLPPALAPVQVVVLVVKDAPEVGGAADALVAELRAAGPPGPTRRPHRHELRPAERRLGAEGRAGPGGSGAPRPGRGQRDRGHAPSAGEGERRPGRGAPTRWRRCWPRPGPSSWPRRRLAWARTADASSLDEAVEAGSVGFAGSVWGALGPDGEDRLAAHAISVRCLQRPDGSLAARATPRRISSPSWAGRTSSGIAIIPSCPFLDQYLVEAWAAAHAFVCRGLERRPRGGDGDEQGHDDLARSCRPSSSGAWTWWTWSSRCPAHGLRRP